MSVRAKLQHVAVTESYGGGKTVKFEPRYDDTIPEDRRFQKATPWGSFEMHIDNPAALEQFKLGRFYYVDFSAVEQEQA